jgi:hypothetical protein
MTDDSKSTLKGLLMSELKRQGEEPGELVQIAIDQPNTKKLAYEDLDAYAGDTGYGSASLPNMYAWTDERVYFKRTYDGSEFVTSVPRDPTESSEEPPERI